MLLQALAVDGYVPAAWKNRLTLRDLVVDVTSTGGTGRSVTLAHIAVIDLMALVMENDWTELRPAPRARLVNLVSEIVRCADGSKLRAANFDASELRWTIVDVPSDSFCLDPRRKNMLVSLLALATAGDLGTSFTTQIESATGPGRTDTLQLIEFLRYPIITIPDEDLGNAFPGLPMARSSAIALLDWLGIS